jgi:hypothetical protein
MESVKLSFLGSPDFKAKPIPSGVERPGTENNEQQLDISFQAEACWLSKMRVQT